MCELVNLDTAESCQSGYDLHRAPAGLRRVNVVGRREMVLGAGLLLAGAGPAWLAYEARQHGGVWLGRLAFWGLMIPGVLLSARGASRWWKSRNYGGGETDKGPVVACSGNPLGW
jgi:hypothetical protein